MKKPALFVSLLVGPLTAGALSLVYIPSAVAASGTSTPGVIITAVNPGTGHAGGDLKISLTAHTEKSSAAAPSCRPQDSTLDCWGSLVLRVPDAGGLSVSGLEVHRVAVGDISCGDDESGDCGGEDGGSCDDQSGGGCEDGVHAAVAVATGAVQAQVNGVAVLMNPGSTGLPVGSKVQLKITLTDNGTAKYIDEVDVQINKFVSGSAKPMLYESGPQIVQQVQIHTLGGQGR